MWSEWCIVQSSLKGESFANVRGGGINKTALLQITLKQEQKSDLFMWQQKLATTY